MKKTIIGLIVGISLATVAVCSYADDNTLTDFRSFGKYLKMVGETDSTNSKIIMKGTSTNVTEDQVNQGIQFYMAEGMDAEEARRKSIEYYEAFNTLYAEAIRRGYDVSEDEVNDYVDQLKDTFAGNNISDESLEQYKSIVSQFDSEDDYWAYERKVYKKILPIQKMNATLEKEYFKEHPDASSEDWSNEFELYKQKLVEAQSFSEVE